MLNVAIKDYDKNSERFKSLFLDEAEIENVKRYKRIKNYVSTSDTSM